MTTTHKTTDAVYEDLDMLNSLPYPTF